MLCSNAMLRISFYFYASSFAIFVLFLSCTRLPQCLQSLACRCPNFSNNITHTILMI